MDIRHHRCRDSPLPWWEQVRLKAKMKPVTTEDPFPSAWERPRIPIKEWEPMGWDYLKLLCAVRKACVCLDVGLYVCIDDRDVM